MDDGDNQACIEAGNGISLETESIFMKCAENSFVIHTGAVFFSSKLRSNNKLMVCYS